jgi:hypothetical protein
MKGTTLSNTSTLPRSRKAVKPRTDRFFNGGIGRVFKAAKSGRWLSNEELAAAANVPVDTATRYRRYFRQPEFGGHTVISKVVNGTTKYRLIVNKG